MSFDFGREKDQKHHLNESIPNLFEAENIYTNTFSITVCNIKKNTWIGNMKVSIQNYQFGLENLLNDKNEFDKNYLIN